MCLGFWSEHMTIHYEMLRIYDTLVHRYEEGWSTHNLQNHSSQFRSKKNRREIMFSSSSPSKHFRFHSIYFGIKLLNIIWHTQL